MSELRQRVRAAIERGESDVCGCDDHRGPAHDVATDLVLAAVAEWLHAEADGYRELPGLGPVQRDRALECAGLLGSLADDIDPRDDE